MKVAVVVHGKRSTFFCKIFTFVLQFGKILFVLDIAQNTEIGKPTVVMIVKMTPMAIMEFQVQRNPNQKVFIKTLYPDFLMESKVGEFYLVSLTVSLKMNVGFSSVCAIYLNFIIDIF